MVASCMLSACGGGGTNTVSTTPSPTPTPTPTPAPALTPTGPILAAAQTSSIPSPVANSTSPSFSTLSSATSVPLLQTTVDLTFGGDATTTNAGAVLTF